MGWEIAPPLDSRFTLALLYVVAGLVCTAATLRAASRHASPLLVRALVIVGTLLMAVGGFLAISSGVGRIEKTLPVDGVSVGLFTFLAVAVYRFPLISRLPQTPRILWAGPDFLCNMTGFLLFRFLMESIQRFLIPIRDARTLASVTFIVSLIAVAVMTTIIVRVLPPPPEVPVTQERSFIRQWLWTRIAAISFCSLTLLTYGEVAQYFRFESDSPFHFVAPVFVMATIMTYTMPAESRLEKACRQEAA